MKRLHSPDVRSRVRGLTSTRRHATSSSSESITEPSSRRGSSAGCTHAVTRDLESAVAPVATVFETIGVEYYLAGSVISSLFGIARATADVDVVASLHHEHVRALVAALQDTYYIDEDVVLDAVRRGSMFNVIHLETMLKVDVYTATSPFDRSAMARRQRDSLVADEPARDFAIASAEDVVLHKLRWYRDGGEVSDRQWSDILGVLRVQGDNLDRGHMRHWAAALGVEDLLERATTEAAR